MFVIPSYDLTLSTSSIQSLPYLIRQIEYINLVAIIIMAFIKLIHLELFKFFYLVAEHHFIGELYAILSEYDL